MNPYKKNVQKDLGIEDAASLKNVFLCFMLLSNLASLFDTCRLKCCVGTIMPPHTWNVDQYNTLRWFPMMLPWLSLGSVTAPMLSSVACAQRRADHVLQLPEEVELSGRVHSALLAASPRQ